MKNQITSTTTIDLIIEAATKGYKQVEVTFNPAYDNIVHGNITNPELIKSLKTSKVSIFDVCEESFDIVRLINNGDVKSMKFV